LLDRAVALYLQFPTVRPTSTSWTYEPAEPLAAIEPATSRGNEWVSAAVRCRLRTHSARNVTILTVVKDAASAARWDGARWVSASGDAWWDGYQWQPFIRTVGDYTVTADGRLWFDGLTWRAILWRPSRLLVGLLAGLELAVGITTLILLVSTAWQLNCMFAAYSATHACGVMNDLWTGWLFGAAIGVGINGAIITALGIAISSRRRLVNQPDLVQPMPASINRQALLTLVIVADVITGLVALFALLSLAGMLGVGGANSSVDIGAIVFVVALLVPFPTVLAATIGVANRSAWARDVSIFAAVVLSLTCVGLLLGIPILVVARGEQPSSAHEPH
jgi:hypothetical protein